MKAWLSLVFTVALASVAYSDGISHVEINGNSFSNISRVYAIAGGKIIIAFDGGGTSATVDQLPADFLASWKINAAGAKAAAAQSAQNELDRAITTGCFREIDGIVYDIRKPQPGWVRFNKVKVVQVLDDAAIVDSTPGDYNNIVGIYVRHLSPAVGDTDYITFTAMQAGSHSYINKNGDDRTIRAYDLGRVCSRSEIPEDVLSGKKASAEVVQAGNPTVDVVATLPESDDLDATGSGFFISNDGYLITNYHVVKNARRLKVKTDGQIYPATVIRTSETNDLALLKVEGQFKALGIATNNAELGESVFTIGFPDIKLQGTEPKYTDGRISSNSGLRDDPTEYQISVPVQPGNSGGPLVDTSGNVKGVIVAMLNGFAALRSVGSLPQNVNYAIKGNVLRDFLGQSPEIKLAAPDGKAGSAVANVRQAVAIVLVY
jgi:S1-C subfamily serine protease